MNVIIRFIKACLILAAEIVLLILLLEGLCSFILVASADKEIRNLAMTRYDEFLGWAPQPGLQERNLYGPGIYFNTNAQTFRGAQIFSKEVPQGKIRILCSGDAFTQGQGVDNDHTWPAQMDALDWRIQTVNLAQGGYGLDQIYLRYVRDGMRLDHQIHIVSLTADNFRRMKNKTFLDIYDKPVLSVRDGRLKVENVPVPGASVLEQKKRQIARMAKALRTHDFLKDVFRRFIPLPVVPSGFDFWDVKGTALAVFTDLERLIGEQKGKLVLVFLPAYEDYYKEDADVFRKWLGAEMAARGVLFVDLVDELRKLSQKDFNHFFKGHYSEAGNRFVAQYLYKVLVASGYLT